MERHYNAFISYRHHPDDIQVASEIHRALERFYVPKSIRKKYGKINRLFRDKEELPITSDLNDDIDAALRNSDYLIVICSVHLKESVWCQREIERFLQTHPKNRVLTVLASGEPYDVIPEILLYDDVVDPVTGETQRIPIEPLSCDWRVKRRKARQEELPRLAAPLLGCAYDELRQRQKQYKARRNAAIISTALAASFSLTAYFLYTSITIQRKNVEIQKANEEIRAANEEIQAANVQIKANLDEALINQSRHLATAAQERLAEGDRLTGIYLAAAALPSKNNERPYVPEAENVLASALSAYGASSQVTAVGDMSPGANVIILEFTVTESESYMYIRDNRSVITVWDMETLQQCGQIDLGDCWSDRMIPLPNNNLLVLAGEYGTVLTCYRPDGSEVWSKEECLDITYLPEAHVVQAICREGWTTHRLCHFDADTGEMLGQPVDLDIAEVPYHASSLLSQDHPQGLPILVRYYDYSESALYIVDPSTGDKLKLDVESVYPIQTLVTRDGKLLMVRSTESSLAGIIEGDRVTQPHSVEITCYDIYTGALLWAAPMTSSLVGTCTLGEIPGSSNILCQMGNRFTVLEKDTGAVVGFCEAGSGVMGVSIGEQYATAVLMDGHICYYWYEPNYCYEVKCMKDEAQEAIVGTGCYVRDIEDDRVIVYRKVAGATQWESDLGGGFGVSSSMVCWQYIAFQDSGTLYLFDTESKSLIWWKERGENDLRGFSTDGSKLFYTAGSTAVVALDIVTGKETSMQIPVQEISGAEEIRGSFFLQKDCLYYVVRGQKTVTCVVWDLNTGKTAACPVEFKGAENILSWYWDVLGAHQQYLWLLGQDQTVLELNMDSGEVQCIVETANQEPKVAVRGDGKQAAVIDGSTVYLKTPGQEEASAIVIEGAEAGSAYFLEDELLVLCGNGIVYRYDASGNLLSLTQISGDFRYGNEVGWVITREGDLIVGNFGTANIIDCDTWSVRATVSNFMMYREAANTLVCKKSSAIVGYPLYSTAELLTVAEQTLNGFRLSEEQKAAYGIN